MTIENNTDYTLKGSQVLALRDYVNAAMNLPGTVVGSGAPTTATEGNVGQFYYDTTNDKFYYCEAKTAQGTVPETYLYTWTLQVSGPTVVQTTGQSTADVMSQKAVTDALASISGVKELTTADYDYPDNNPTGVALWRLDGGLYKTSGSVSLFISATTTIAPNSGETILILKAPSSNPNYVRTFIMFQNPNSYNLPDTYVISNSGSDVLDGNKWATLSNIYADPSTTNRIKIGKYTSTTDDWSVAIGSGYNSTTLRGASAAKNGVAIGYASTAASSSTAIGSSAKAGAVTDLAKYSVAVGNDADASYKGSVALGARSTTTRIGEVNVGTSLTGYGYNSTNYRVIGGVHDPVDNHDAATKGYVDGLVGDIESALYDINNGGSN